MPDRTLHRLVAFISTFIVLTVATSHLRCVPHEFHAEEVANVAQTHAFCECAECACAIRDATLATPWKSFDEVKTPVVAVVANWRNEDPLNYVFSSVRWLMPPSDYASSEHLRFQNTIVILT